MYTHYTRNKDIVLVKKIDMEYEVFDNVDNIELILKQYNNIKCIKSRKKWLLLLNDKNDELTIIKKQYLDLKEELETKKLDELQNKSTKIFSKNVSYRTIENTNFIEDLDKKLKLIDYYFDMRYKILNHKDFNIIFSTKENQKKELSFINLCASNINEPLSFINELIQADKSYSFNNQKELKYEV